MQIQQNDVATLEGKIKAEALRLGFNLCGITSPEPPGGFARYANWLSNGLQAGMTYLESDRHRVMRQHPDQLVPGVRSIISLGWPYTLQQLLDLGVQPVGLIAGYTADVDYHLLLPVKMDLLIEFIQKELGRTMHALAFTDSAPILEREIASRAGLGWIGKNSCLISPEVGSAFLLAEIFIDYPLRSDPPFSEDRCGTCHRCLDACPTGCIQADRTIDSGRCISYLTIENKVDIPEALRSSPGMWLFGCDICQSVCPWNKRIPDKLPQAMPQTWSLDEILKLLTITTDEFSTRFKDSALLRSKLKGLQRNAIIWLGNNGNGKASTHIEKFSQQIMDPDLTACAEWAINRIKKSEMVFSKKKVPK